MRANTRASAAPMPAEAPVITVTGRKPLIAFALPSSARDAETRSRSAIRSPCETPSRSAARQIKLSSNSVTTPSVKAICHIISTMRARPASSSERLSGR